jgi:hypothetical protein
MSAGRGIDQTKVWDTSQPRGKSASTHQPRTGNRLRTRTAIRIAQSRPIPHLFDQGFPTGPGKTLPQIRHRSGGGCIPRCEISAIRTLWVCRISPVRRSLGCFVSSLTATRVALPTSRSCRFARRSGGSRVMRSSQSSSMSTRYLPKSRGRKPFCRTSTMRVTTSGGLLVIISPIALR